MNLFDKIEWKIGTYMYRHSKLIKYMPDKLFIQQEFFHTFQYKIDLRNPQTFNEKLNWRKLYERNPLFTLISDKCKVKDWVKEKIGNSYIIPTLGVYDSFEEIDFEKLPEKFVIKCNHDSGSIVICQDKHTFEIQKARKIITDGLQFDFYMKFREWPYKNIKRKIIIEKYLEDSSISHFLTDYKFFCFNGIPQFIYLDSHIGNQGYINYLTIDWKQADIHRKDYPEAPELPAKPKELNEMLQLARKLSEGISFVRVDFYVVEGQIYFGEMTLLPGAGFTPYYPEYCDAEIGKLFQINRFYKIKCG